MFEMLSLTFILFLSGIILSKPDVQKQDHKPYPGVAGQDNTLHHGSPGLDHTLHHGPPGLASPLHHGAPGLDYTLPHGPPGMDHTVHHVVPGPDITLHHGAAGLDRKLHHRAQDRDWDGLLGPRALRHTTEGGETQEVYSTAEEQTENEPTLMAGWLLNSAWSAPHWSDASRKDCGESYLTCPDGKTCCPDLWNTCCPKPSAAAGVGCCPLSNAVCCPGGDYCCPEDYICSDSGVQQCSLIKPANFTGSPLSDPPTLMTAVPLTSVGSTELSSTTPSWREGSPDGEQGERGGRGHRLRH